MAARATLADIIPLVRDLINDPAGTPLLSDDRLQKALDDNRADWQDLLLSPAPHLVLGRWIYLDYYSDVAPWEADVVLIQYLGVVLSPLSYPDSEPLLGHWRFAVPSNQPIGVLPPVYARGKTFDLYRAACQCLRQIVAMQAGKFDYSSGEQKFMASQLMKQSQALLTLYESMAQPYSVKITRDDT